jgi:hypothetical protein
VRPIDGLLEHNAPAFYLVEQAAFPLLDGCMQLIFKSDYSKPDKPEPKNAT